jgi:hypothetical protein
LFLVPLLLAAALVTIRIYNYAAVPPAELDAARAVASRIFHDAGLAVEWEICRVPNSAEGAASTAPLRDGGEFVLRLQTSATVNLPLHVELGSSLLDGTGGGVLITLDPRLVDAVALQAHAEAGLVLGRAIAHEVGHLLIGTARHSPHGLMRELWSQKELRENRPGDWAFSSQEAALMKRSLTGELGN